MVALENVLNDCDEISQVFKSNISAAFRSEAQLEAARQTDRDALDQQLLPTPVSYTAPYVQFPWNLIGAEQAKICSKINDSLIPLDYLSKSLKHWSQHFDVLFKRIGAQKKDVIWIFFLMCLFMRLCAAQKRMVLTNKIKVFLRDEFKFCDES